MNIFRLFFPKKNKEKKVLFGYKRTDFYEIRPLYDLKDNLIYQHCALLFDNDSVKVLAKVDKEVNYKFVIVYNFEEYKKMNLSNEMLVSDNLGKEFKYGFKIEQLGKIDLVEIIIFAEATKEIVEYCIGKPVQNNNLYQMAFIYDEETIQLNQFRLKKTFGPLFKEFKIAMYHDVGAIDREDY